MTVVSKAGGSMLIRAAGSSPRDLKTVAFSTPLAFTWRLLR